MYIVSVPISEVKSVSYGGLSLDLLLKFGVLVRKHDGMNELAEDYEAISCYIVGDVNTVNNMDTIMIDLSSRKLSSEETFNVGKYTRKLLVE